MFNVLPDNIKKSIKKEYRLRRWIIIVECLIFISVSFIILLFPTWLLTLYHNKEVRLEMEAQQKFIASRNTKNVFNIIDGTNEKLNVINQTFEYSRVMPLLNTIISTKNSNISLRNISLSTSGTSTASISLSGVAGNRDALVSFVKRLGQVSGFSNIISPVSNLTKDSNIDFNLTLISNK